jgi:23S rRNA (uridine2552-2'-O)-methyltransferase
LPKPWDKERRKEYYYRKAKAEKFRSRAAYKLLQATKKYGFVKLGYVVLDLGAAPGGWMQAASRIVGSTGFVLGVDLKGIEPINEPNVRNITGDIRDSKIIQLIQEHLPRPADVVVSDVSPNISGIWELDHARQIDLARNAMQVATYVLKPKGSFFVKVFQGDLLQDFVNEVKRYFGFVKLVKPKASRAKSSELYILGTNCRKLA